VQCPECHEPVPLAGLEYDRNTQETLCPNLHRVIRHWMSPRWGAWELTSIA
jgi:hypothetical protein